MQTNISYLLQPQKRLDKQQIHLRMQSIPAINPKLDRPEESPAEAQAIPVAMITPAGASPAARGVAAIKWLYRWLARFVLFALLLLLASLVLFLRAPATHGESAQEVAPTPHMTAKTAHAAARSTAIRWAADSTLVSLTATWDSGHNFHGGEGDWSLLFYSPSTVSTALISVVDGQATLIDSHGVAKIDQRLETGLWQIDSPTVVEQLKAGGGDEFLRGQPDAGLALSLNLIGEPTWKARLIHQESRRVFSVRIGIDDGQIVEVHQSG